MRRVVVGQSSSAGRADCRFCPACGCLGSRTAAGGGWLVRRQVPSAGPVPCKAVGRGPRVVLGPLPTLWSGRWVGDRGAGNVGVAEGRRGGFLPGGVGGGECGGAGQARRVAG